VLKELGLPVAEAQIATFDQQKVLVVQRFDRRWIGADTETVNAPGFSPANGVWIARLPQEDFCQATGRPPSQRYESDGGPPTLEILDLLSSSDNAETDRAHFVLAQLAFWLLAATDGHGKNFSIHLERGGTFKLTPLYDVLSAWPVIGRGANQLPIQDAKLAMAVTGRNRHYRIQEIQTRHWHELAKRVGGPDLWQRMVHLVESAPAAFDSIAPQLPDDFPEVVAASIRAGVEDQSRRFLATIAER
jgi:serine/threonine-protein kinase HipA